MKRSREEVIEKILEICREPATKTKVVYQVNLNFRTVNPYLDLLTKSSLLEINRIGDSSAVYRITPKGAEALGHIKALRALLKPIDESND
jgi:predicted transcriptional regulator